MGNLIRFLLPVCTPRGHVARNHLTKFPESPINPSGQADPLKAWNRRICIMQNVSIPTFVRDTVLNPRQDLLSMVSLYSQYQVVMCVHSARDTTLISQHSGPHTSQHAHPYGGWLQYVHCKQFHCLIADQAETLTSDHKGHQLRRSIL